MHSKNINDRRGHPNAKKRLKRADIEDNEIKEIERILKEETQPSGANPGNVSRKDDGTPTQRGLLGSRKFEELPISRYTKNALKKGKFVTMTAIQRAVLPHALVGRDVLGAAKTGSGKTLAFLIPMLETLYRLKWGQWDGLGALIISPTRELALQIFEELRVVGSNHEFSAGLLIGGKNVEEEASRVGAMNILVATPGRLLQHMDESPDFNADNLKILILDEADRILDMGFSATVNAIIKNLPKERQTMLFSATQTKSVGALARLSLKDPEYVSAHAEATTPTPMKLEQAFMICNLQDKMDIVWSFIKTHLHSRIIIFFSTCKQVKFVYEAFRRLRPGTPLRCLHGRMSQHKRMTVYQQFCDSKAGTLFATDIAARGLDFPAVDWVVQADCPEDVAAYIHRVGRTARYINSGKGLLLLLPSEQIGMNEALEEAKIKLKSLKYNKDRIQPVTPALQALLSKDAELKSIAQRALISYIKSVFLQPKKNIFDVNKLPVVEFAFSLGLTTVPKLKMLSKSEVPSMYDAKKAHNNSENEEVEGRKPMENVETVPSDMDATDNDDFLVLKRTHDEDQDPTDAVETRGDKGLQNAEVDVTKKKKKKMKIDPYKSTGSKIIFDEEGEAMDPLEALAVDMEQLKGKNFKSVEERAAEAQKMIKERDVEDKIALKQLRKQKRDAKRARRLAREQGTQGSILLHAAREEQDYLSDSDDEYKGEESDSHRYVEMLDSDDSRQPGQEAAHFGMAPKNDFPEGKSPQSKKKTQSSLAEQEAAILKMIRSQ